MEHLQLATEVLEQSEENENVVSVFDTDSVESILNDLNGISITAPARTDVSLVNGTISTEAIEHGLDAINNIQVYDGTNEEASESLSNPGLSQNEVNDFLTRIEEDFKKTNDETKENESRFSGAEWYEKVKQLDVLIAGIGGIGSWLSLLMSRMHPLNISLFDYDMIEEANLSGQLFSTSDIGMLKCQAIKKKMASYSMYTSISVYNEKYIGQKTSDIMMCGFDNMTARKMFFHSWKSHVDSRVAEENRNKCLYLDARLGMEELQIFAIRGDEPENMKRYMDEYLFDDSEAEQVPCSMKQTSFMASMIGSIMTNLFVNFATNIDEPIDIRPIPFLTMYNASDMRLITKFQ